MENGAMNQDGFRALNTLIHREAEYKRTPEDMVKHRRGNYFINTGFKMAKAQLQSYFRAHKDWNLRERAKLRHRWGNYFDYRGQCGSREPPSSSTSIDY